MKQVRRNEINDIIHQGVKPFWKGYIYTMEVLIAISLILISGILILRTPLAKPDFSTSTMKLQGFEALEYLDNKGDLRLLVSQDNNTEIKNRILGILPKGIRFETQICNFSCSEGNVPTHETVVVINYYISGYQDSYVGKKVKLWLWRKS